MTSRNRTWPTAELGDLARLRALAAGLPGVHLHERTLDADFEDVWSFISDLEVSTPLFEPDVSSLRILSKDGDRWRVRVRMPRWMATVPAQFDVTMRHGSCWMVSRPQVYVIGIAAEPAASGTRLAHMEGVVLPAPRWLGPAVRPLLAVSRWRHRYHVPRDVARMATHVEIE